MIFYFSGTGNSAWVAQCVSKGVGDTNLLFIPDVGTYEYTLALGEALGFVFPCYAWGVPVFVEEFVRKLNVRNVDYVYFVCTCGDDTGKTKEIFCKLMEQKGWKCSLGYSVQMPESYVNLPGFDVDPKEKERRKISVAEEKLQYIVNDIAARRTDVFDTLPGRFTWLKSCVVRPFFNRFLITPRPFKTNGMCVACGKCVTACPYHNIELKECTPSGPSSQLPVWSDNCVGCMRCYHSCPAKAIEWGRFTKGKGQYLFEIRN